MKDFAAGFFTPWLIYALLLALHLALPARRVEGYVRDRITGERLRYRLNGPLVLLFAVGLWALAGRLGLLPWDWLYTHRWSSLAGSSALGLAFSLAMVLRGGYRSDSRGSDGRDAEGSGRSFLSELYRGRDENPQYLRGRVDAKMFLYLAGAAMLTLNLLSFFAHHLALFGSGYSPGVALYCFLFFWFVVDYIVFERVHLYTYDFFAERVGFKLGWGCLVFYPYFYALGLWATAELPDPNTASWLLVLYRCVFFAGWILSRGANLQKYLFKTSPERALLGILKPKTLSDGKHELLCSGFWRVSRHVNYLGEILMAIGLTLSLGWPATWVIWLYPLYYVALLLPRERADERRCAAKYGELWEEYVRRVPKRIVPGIY
jgi:protein-S-isoprenylcysteine O-methyltransferase Ste14